MQCFIQTYDWIKRKNWRRVGHKNFLFFIFPRKSDCSPDRIGTLVKSLDLPLWCWQSLLQGNTFHVMDITDLYIYYSNFPVDGSKLSYSASSVYYNFLTDGDTALLRWGCFLPIPMETPRALTAVAGVGSDTAMCTFSFHWLLAGRSWKSYVTASKFWSLISKKRLVQVPFLQRGINKSLGQYK